MWGEERDADDPLALANPVVLIEVTSDSSEAYDQGERFEHCKKIPSLAEFVIVSHREPCVTVFRKGTDTVWGKADELRKGAVANLTSIGCALAVDEIYADPFVT